MFPRERFLEEAADNALVEDVVAGLELIGDH
jgi:hypothetical protein